MVGWFVTYNEGGPSSRNPVRDDNWPNFGDLKRNANGFANRHYGSSLTACLKPLVISYEWLMLSSSPIQKLELVTLK